jgi:hypothetical protein
VFGNLDADLVLEGGGVKGIALVGAISVLEERGYTFHKVPVLRRVPSLVRWSRPACALTICMRSCEKSPTGGSKIHHCWGDSAVLVLPPRLCCTRVGVAAATCIRG